MPAQNTIRYTQDSYILEVCEMLGTRSEELGPDEFVGKVQLKVPYNNRFALVYHIYMNDCTWPWNSDAYFRSASIQPFLGGAYPTPDIPDDVGGPQDAVIAQTLEYEYALINLTYSTLEAITDKYGNPVVNVYIETFEPQVEFQIMSPELFHWGQIPKPKPPDDGRPLTIKEAPARQIRTSVYTVKWLQRQRVPKAFYDYIGMVHDADYTIENFGTPWDPAPQPPETGGILAKAETLLFMPGPVEKSIWYKPGMRDFGDPQWDEAIDEPGKIPYPGYNYTCKFAYRPSTWNKYFRGDHKIAQPPPDPVDPWEEYERIYQSQPTPASSKPFENYPMKDLSSLLPSPATAPGP